MSKSQNISELIIQEFAATDGLLRGTALFANLVAITSFALLPSFGNNAVLVSAFVLLVISTILEIPTGLIADIFGCKPAVRLALCLKFFVTFAFLLAVIASLSGHITLSWILIAIEGIADAFASSFLNGAYQAAYLEWYDQQTISRGGSRSSSLFLASYKYAWRIRFAIPIISTLFLLALQYACVHLKIIGSNQVVYLAISLVILLRTATAFRVFKQLSKIPDRNSNPKARIKSLLSDSIKSPYMLLCYSIGCFLMFISTFVFVGSALHLFGQFWGSEYLFLLGVVFGTCVYLMENAVSVVLLPKLALRTGNGIRTYLILFIFGSASIAYLLSSNVSPVFKLVLIVSISLLSTITGNSIQRLIQSELSRITPNTSGATWLSVGTSIGLGTASAVCGVFLRSDNLDFSLPILVSITTLAAIYCLWALNRFLKATTTNSFQDVLSKRLTKLFSAFLFAFALAEAVAFTQSTLSTERTQEVSITNMIETSIREPLSQGSFPEAVRRLEKMTKTGSILCSSLHAWDSSTTSCGNKDLSSFKTSLKKLPLYFDDSRKDQYGELDLVFDQSAVWNGIALRAAIAILFWAISSLIFFRWLSNFGSDISDQLDEVLLAANREKVHESKISILEFQKLLEALSEAWKTKAAFNRQVIVAQLATQVAHDIRSPVTALRALMEASDLDQDKKSLMAMIAKRINSVADDLLKASKISPAKVSKLSVYSTNEIFDLLDTVVQEKRTSISSLISIEIDREFDSISKVLIDENELQRMFANLITNSIEAIDSSGKIVVSLSCDDQDLVLSVADNGIGIDESVLHLVVNRGGTFGKANGNGYGLSHAKRVTESWGGKLEITSAVGSGTRVRCRLPKSLDQGKIQALSF